MKQVLVMLALAFCIGLLGVMAPGAGAGNTIKMLHLAVSCFLASALGSLLGHYIGLGLCVVHDWFVSKGRA